MSDRVWQAAGMKTSSARAFLRRKEYVPYLIRLRHLLPQGREGLIFPLATQRKMI